MFGAFKSVYGQWKMRRENGLTSGDGNCPHWPIYLFSPGSSRICWLKVKKQIYPSLLSVLLIEANIKKLFSKGPLQSVLLQKMQRIWILDPWIGKLQILWRRLQLLPLFRYGQSYQNDEFVLRPGWKFWNSYFWILIRLSLQDSKDRSKSLSLNWDHVGEAQKDVKSICWRWNFPEAGTFQGQRERKNNLLD